MFLADYAIRVSEVPHPISDGTFENFSCCKEKTDVVIGIEQEGLSIRFSNVFENDIFKQFKKQLDCKTRELGRKIMLKDYF